MPSIKTITPIQEDRYYHIFNRGNNKRKVFFNDKNYRYFLTLFDQNLSPYVSLIAYCLLENHFHLLIKTKTAEEVTGILGMSSFGRDDIPKISKQQDISKLISNQFRRLFISYTMAINKQEDLKGNLFDRPFKRLEIEDEDYLKYLTFYIHYNPQKHGITNNFKDYGFSSWKAYQSNGKTKLNKQLLFEIFEGKVELLNFHNYYQEEKEWLNLE